MNKTMDVKQGQEGNINCKFLWILARVRKLNDNKIAVVSAAETASMDFPPQ